MTSPLLESRRELRKCAFQALMSLNSEQIWKQLVTLPTRMTVKMQMCKSLPFF